MTDFAEELNVDVRRSIYERVAKEKWKRWSGEHGVERVEWRTWSGEGEVSP